MKLFTHLHQLAAATLLILLCSPALNAQITITADNMPVPDTLHTDSIASLIGTVPVISNGIEYDYRDDTLYVNFETAGELSTTFRVIPDFPYLEDLIAAGGDKYINNFVAFGNGLTYSNFQMMDFNESGVFQVGQSYNSQAYSLGPFTQNPSDSIYFQISANTGDAPLTYQQFPYTLGSNWTDTMRLVTDFILDIPAFGIPMVPGQHVFYKVRTDSILGYGTVRLYTPDGPSEAYEVLVNQHHSYKQDSFYLGGMAASAQLLTSFGLAQGQTNSHINYIDLVAADIYPYLVRFTYDGLPGDYSSPDEVFSQRGLALPSSTFEVTGAQYATLVYPNPSTGSRINVQLTGTDFPALVYQVTDQLGRSLQTGELGAANNGTLNIAFAQTLPAGNYNLSLFTPNGRLVATEAILVQH